MKEIIDRILSEQTALKSLPQTLAEVLKIVRDEDSSAQQLSDVLLKDPALTAKILRIANSPYYGIGREISSMNQAVITLGMRQVTALALSSSVYNLTSGWKGAIDRVRFWRHSLEVAIASRMIVEQAGCGNPEDAFVSGLLHDLGLLILENSFPEDCHRIHQRARQGESLIDLEEESWNTNHARVGQFMLEQWNIPQAVCTAVGHHHDVFPPGATNPDMALSQVVALGNLLSRFSLRDDDHSQMVVDAENREIIATNLSLPGSKVADVQRQLFSKTMEEARYLEIEIGSSDELLREANQMLFQQYLAVEDLLRENRTLQRQLSQDRMKRVAGESLRDIAVSLNKHITIATGSLESKVRSIQETVRNSGGNGCFGDMEESLQTVVEGIGAIGSVMKDLANLACLETDGVPDSDRLMDVEERIKSQLDRFTNREVLC